MSSPELAEVLLECGRYRVGPIVEDYLQQLSDSGEIAITSGSDAFVLLYGLVIQDTQITVLLGQKPPSKREIERRATIAVDRFLE